MSRHISSLTWDAKYFCPSSLCEYQWSRIKCVTEWSGLTPISIYVCILHYLFHMNITTYIYIYTVNIVLICSHTYYTCTDNVYIAYSARVGAPWLVQAWRQARLLVPTRAMYVHENTQMDEWTDGHHMTPLCIKCSVKVQAKLKWNAGLIILSHLLFLGASFTGGLLIYVFRSIHGILQAPAGWNHGRRHCKKRWLLRFFWVPLRVFDFSGFMILHLHFDSQQ